MEFRTIRRGLGCGLLVVLGSTPLSGGFAQADSTAPIIGLYSVPAAACSLVAACGFNVVHSYDYETTSWKTADAYVRALDDYLNTAERHGLRVLAGVPRSWLRNRDAGLLREAIRALRSRRNLLAWYEDERAQSGDFEAVAFLDRVVSEEDPRNGLVIEESGRDKRLLAIGRARMFTYYPVTTSRGRRRLFPISRRVEIGALRVPFWPVLQAYGQDRIEGFPKPRLITPMFQELRYTLYTALMAGAEGVFFYPYRHPTRFDSKLEKRGKWPYLDYRPLPEIDADFWNDLITCVSEARLLLNLIDGTRAVPADLENAPLFLERRRWETQQGALVLLGNPTYKAMRVSVPAMGRTTYRVLENGSWSDPRQVSGDVVAAEITGPGGISLLLR